VEGAQRLSPGLFAFWSVEMNYQVQVYEIARDAKPDERPRALERFAVGADTAEGARRAVLDRLASEGRVVRSLSFLKDGGLAAVVNPPATTPAAPPSKKNGAR
jgi:hypothetical protein